MASTVFQDIKTRLGTRYLDDRRPWLVGSSGGKDSTRLASLPFEVVADIPKERRTKPVKRFVEKGIDHWGEAILHLGARRAESATRSQMLGKRDTRDGQTRPPDLPRAWGSISVQLRCTEEALFA